MNKTLNFFVPFAITFGLVMAYPNGELFSKLKPDPAPISAPAVSSAEKVKPVTLGDGWGWTYSHDMFLKLTNVKITNNTNYDIKDPEIYCSAFGESGTFIDSNSRQQFKVIKAGETLDLGSVDMGFLRNQVQKVGCSIRTHAKVG